MKATSQTNKKQAVHNCRNFSELNCSITLVNLI